MSQKGKARRAAFKARQEQEGKKVVRWIFIVLIILAIIYIAYSFSVIQN